MKELCIVPCGLRKIWSNNPQAGPTKARSAYTGTFTRKCIQYAQAFHPGSYLILSAKYGLIQPDFIIPGDYNITFNEQSPQSITSKQLRQQAQEAGCYDRITVIGGRRYASRIRETFAGTDVHAPLSQCRGIGYMMKMLAEAIHKGKPLP